MQNNDSSATLKSLELRRKNLVQTRDLISTELAAINKTVRDLNERFNSTNRQLDDVDRQLSNLKNSEIGFVISEHAILRYLQRVVGIDLEDIKKSILPPEVQKQAKALGGSGKFPVSNTHSVRLKKGVVVTIISKDSEEN